MLDGKMRKRLVAAVTTFGAVILVAVGATAAAAAPPVVNGHDHFISDPYPDEWCGIEGTSVDTVVAHFMEREDGSTLEAINVTTVFTATESGKSMLIRQTGARRRSAPIDNGDGTYSVIVSNSGQSPGFKLVQGPVLALDVGLVQLRLTFDAETGEWLGFERGFEVLKEAGQRPVLDCDAVIAALS